MKKTFRNIRTLAALLMAGAAFAACSSSEDSIIEQQPANPGEQVYTLTVNATKDGGSQTRALNLDGEKLVASWETTDYIAVINKTKYYSPSGYLKPTNISADGNSATLTGEVTGVDVDDDLILAYHYHSISDFAGQNGMLNGEAEKSAEAYDQAEATVTVASIDGSGNITTTADASFTTQTAMIKFTLQDNAATPNKINATSLNVKATITLPAPLSTITEDLFTFTIDPVVYTYNGNGILYYALPSAATLAGPIATKLQADPYNLTTITESDVVTALASATITFTASDGVNTYVATKTGYPFTAGNYYTTTLTMAKRKALSEVTASELGWRIGSDGMAYEATGALPTGVNAVAKIVYVGSDNGESAPYNHGLALALSDANGNNTCQWSTSHTKVHTYNPTDKNSFASESGLQYNATQNSDTYPAFKAAIANNGTAAPTGCSSWFLASRYQWNKMAGANGYGLENLKNSSGSYSGLWTSADYWSSTEYNANIAWDFYSFDGDWLAPDKSLDGHVRSCLAF